MSQEARYYRVGLFVFVGIAVLVSGILLFGGTDIFRQTLTFETFFSESVQGLEVGSPVKLRGVKIGTVKDISLAGDVYEGALRGDNVVSADSNVVVTMSYTADREGAEALTYVRAQKRLEHLIARGLRLRLTTQGITGTVYIEADFYDPKRYPVSSPPWPPQNLYIPSIPSTFKEFSTAAERIMGRLEDVDVEGAVTNFNELLDTLNTSADELDLGAVQDAAIGMMDDFRKTADAMRGAIEQAEQGVLSADVGQTLDQFDAVLVDLQRLLVGGRGDVASSLDNVRAITENVRDLTDTLRSYPSLLLFGGAPEPSSMEGSK